MSRDPDAGRVRRALRAAGALAGVAGLAGCGGLSGGGSPAVTSDPGTDRPTTDDPTPTQTPTRTPCPTPDESLPTDPGAVESALAETERDLRVARLRRAFLDGGRSLQPGGVEDATVDRAASVADDVAESVVHLPIPGDESGPFYTPGGATGWFLGPHEVVTNAHVVGQTPDPPTGRLRDGTEVAFEVVAAADPPYSEPFDLALLRTDHEGTPLSTGDPSTLDAGQAVLLVGNPRHFGTWTPTLGRYVYDGETLAAAGVDETTAEEAAIPFPKPSGFACVIPAQAGSSGSPLVTLAGDVVGTIWFGWQSVPGSMTTGGEEPFVYDRPIAPRAHSSNYHRVDEIQDWVAENR